MNQNSHGGIAPDGQISSGSFVDNGGGTMAKGYSNDLRARVVNIVEAGASRREAARLLDIGASTAIRWIERWTGTGSVAAKPGTGHCRSRRTSSGCSIWLPRSPT